MRDSSQPNYKNKQNKTKKNVRKEEKYFFSK